MCLGVFKYNVEAITAQVQNKNAMIDTTLETVGHLDGPGHSAESRVTDRVLHTTMRCADISDDG